MSERVIPIMYESDSANRNQHLNDGAKLSNNQSGRTIIDTKYEPEPNTNNRSGFEWIRLNYAYFKTLPGKLKIIELILGIVLISLTSPIHQHVTFWFTSVVVFVFIATLIWTFVYFLSIREAVVLPVDWVLSELFNTFLSAVLYVIVSFIQILSSLFTVISSGHVLSFIVGIFGALNSIVYVYATYLLYNEWQLINRV